MNTSRIAVVSALLCIGAWTLKSIAIGLAGGLNLSPLEGPLFLTGLAASLIAAVFLGLALSTGSAPVVRVLAGIASLVVGSALGAAVNAVVESMRPADASWVWSEINLWIFAAVLLVAAVWSRSVWRTRGAVAVGPDPA